MFDAELVDLIRAALKRGDSQTDIALALNGAVAAFLTPAGGQKLSEVGAARVMFNVKKILDPYRLAQGGLLHEADRMSASGRKSQ